MSSMFFLYASSIFVMNVLKSSKTSPEYGFSSSFSQNTNILNLFKNNSFQFFSSFLQLQNILKGLIKIVWIRTFQLSSSSFEEILNEGIIAYVYSGIPQINFKYSLCNMALFSIYTESGLVLSIYSSSTMRSEIIS